MNICLKRSCFAIALWLISTIIFAQSGPGGKGTTDGTSNLVLWLRADAGVLEADLSTAEDGEALFQWSDQSGYDYHALVGGGTPSYDDSDADFGGMPSILFVDGNTDWLTIEDDADEAPQLDNTSEISIFYVYNPDNSSGVRAHLVKRDGNGSAQSYVFYENGSQNSRINGNNDSGQNINGGTTYINATTYQNGDFDHFLNQTSGGGVSGGTASIPNNNSDLNIGEFQNGDGRTFDGNFAEIIIFREYLSNAERIVVETYLGSKYGIALGSDFWDEATYATYNNEIAGIGQHTDATIANSATSGALTISGGDDRANGEWIFWGHDNADFSSYTGTEVITGSSHQRLAREWVVNETNDLGNVTVSIPVSDLPSTGVAAPAFYLYVDADGVFTDATPNLMTLNGGNYEVDVDLAEGDRLAIAFEPPVPAGITTSLAFWFDAGSGVQNAGIDATDGQTVTVWSDLSVNGANGQNGTSPTYSESNAINYRPIVRFDAASSEYLEFDITGLEGADYSMMAVVQRASNTANQYILGSENNATDALLLGYSSNTQLDLQNSNSATSNTAVSGFDAPVEGPALVAVNYNSTNLDVDEFRDGTNNSGTTATGTDYAATGYTGNIGRALSGNYLDGDIAEIVAFDANLSPGDFNAMASQLAIKYGIDLGMDYVDEQANLLWDFSDNTGYTEDVIAIGRDDSFVLDQRISTSTTDSVLIASDVDFTSLNEAGSRTSLADGQYVFMSNDDDPFTFDQSYNGTSNLRIDRTWSIREVGAPGAVTIAVRSSAIDANVLLVSSDPTFGSGVTELSLASSGGYVYATHDFSDGDYFTFVNDPSEIWYSYISGNWSDPQNWTLDGAISALYVNPLSKVPGAGDSVVVKSGRTIDMDLNNVNVTKVEIIGTLDLAATTGHDLGYLEGIGTMRLSGFGGVDNYPTAIDTAFYESLEGGTVEYYGTGITLDQIRRYNNLIINLDNPTDLSTMTGDSLYVFGDFTVERGMFQINDNSATSDLAILVQGNMIVEANGTVDVGTANARHELNLYGDFTNYGDVDFTNRTSQSTGSEATNGIVDFNLLSDNSDQTITLENITHFYRIEVDKGTDQTYVADFQASDPTYFELYGFANQGHGAIAQLTSNTNAVGLLVGTLKAGINIDLGALNTGGNYNVSEGAELWIDGGSAFKNGGTAIVPYGSIRVSSGTLNADINSGITSRGNGTLFMEGGEVTIRQFRTSVFGATNQGGIVMTGGILNINGETNGGIAGNYYPLNLTYSGNAFIMSGGTLNISGANAKGGVFINSSTENILTGGSLNFISSTNNPFVISSRAAFFNVVLSKTSATGGDFLIGTGQSGPSGTDETVEDLPFEILNDLTLDNSDGNGVTADLQGNDLEIQGSLNLDAGSSIDLTDNTLILEGAGSSSLNIGLATTLVLDSLQINKNNELVTSNIISGQATAIQIDHYLNVTSGNFDIGAFDITVNGNINLVDTVGSATSTGQVYMNGGVAQAITTTGTGAIYDLEIDNASGVSLDGDMGIPDQLALNAGVFDIGADQLTLRNEPTTTGAFSTTLMIQTAGNASDGGLSQYVDETETLIFPIGVAGKYTPVSADFPSFTGDGSDDGYVIIRAVDAELGTTNLAGGDALSYYWNIDTLGIQDTGAPLVTYQFTYDDTDTDTGVQLTGGDDYFAGKVLDLNPYTRSSEGAEIIGTNVISFDAAPFTLERANYTAGEVARFTGDVLVYYSKETSTDGNLNFLPNWSSASSWVRSDQLTDLNADTFIDENDWHRSDNPDSPDAPGAGDIAVIGFIPFGDPNTSLQGSPHHVNINGTTETAAELLFTQMVDGSGDPVQRDPLRFWALRPSVLITGAAGQLNAGIVGGEGEFFIRFGADPDFSVVDLGDFNDQDSSLFFYEAANNRVYANSPDEMPNLILGTSSWGRNDRNIEFTKDVVTRQNVEILGDANLVLNSGATGDMTIGGNLIFFESVGAAIPGCCTSANSGGGAEIRYPNTGNARTITVNGDLIMNNAAGLISVNSPGTTPLGHTMNVYGSISQNTTTNGLVFWTASGEDYIDLNLLGSESESYDLVSGAIPVLNNLLVNKGTDTTSVFRMNTDFDLNGSFPEAFDLQKGKLVLDNASINIEIANGNDFHIPAGSGLEVTQGDVTMDGAVIILDGLLKVNGGSVTLTDTDIEYSNTGFAVIEVSSGSFEVGNILRRAITTSTGVLKYRQTGGTVLIASDNAPTYSPSRAAFEVANTGSEFIFTGGSFTIQRGVTGDNNISLLLTPETHDITGSTITLGNANTPSYGANYFNLKTSVELNNLTIFDDGDDNFPPVRLLALPLTVNGTLDIAANTGLIANGFDVTLNGDFSNEGTYTNISSTTTFGSATSQSITGAGTFTIYDLTKVGAGEAQTNQNLSLSHDLRVEEGTLNIQDNTLSLRNDAYIESTVTNTGASNGVVFNGTSNQDLYGVANQTVTLGTITVENAAGVDIADGNGFNFDLTDRLRLNGGVFNIGGSLVTIKRGGYVEEVSTFNANNMVQTNSSFTDNGFRQEFYGVAADTTIFFPVGELKYTPVQFDFDAGTTQGDIRVRPANEMHPTVIDNTEPLTETEIVDADYALQYYWIVIAQDVTNANGTATYFYDHDDVRVVGAAYDTTNYISARLLSNGVTWDKYAPTEFWGGTTSFRVPLSSANSALITGDYTAGVGSSDGINNDIEGALPDELAQYDSNFGGTGGYSADGSWTPVGSSPALVSGNGPVGAQITISTGDDVALDLSNIRLYSTHIESGAILRVPTASLGNRLGTVTGTGTIVLEDTELLPAGEYSAFIACDGGGLQYSGTTSYSVLSGISQIRNVTFDGSGTRIMPNNALDVCDVLTINGPAVDFDAGQTYNIGDSNAESDGLDIQSGTATVTNGTVLNVTGDFTMSGGGLAGNAGTELQVSGDVNYAAGTLSWNSMDFVLDGPAEQMIDGDFTGASQIDDLTINNSSSAGVTINSGDIVIDGQLTFIDGLVNTTSTETLTLTSNGDWTGATSASYVTGPITKESVAVSSTYEFPVGKAARYAPVAVANVVTGSDDWTAEYFTSTGATYPDTMYDPADPGSGKNAISDVKSTDRWEVTSAGSNSAQVRVAYGAHDGFTDEDDIRVVWWDGADSRWENVGAITSGNTTSGTSRSEDFIGFSTQQFGLADAPEVPLPVELVFFDAQLANSAVHVSWQTATEINNDYFEVQRSADGKNWEVIGKVYGAGDSDNVLDYSFTDATPYLGISYYRLEQFDYDGASETFNTVAVQNTTFGTGVSLILKPNPTNADNINFEVQTGDDHTPIFIKMVNVSGQVSFSKELDPSSLRIEERIVPVEKLSAGLYFVTVVQGEHKQLLKLIIER